MKDCDVCGNEIDGTALQCRFCGSRQSLPAASGPRDSLRTLNIEAGRPSVEEGLARLENDLARARLGGARVVRVIHGWGSTGTGGKLRDACRAYLNRELKARRVKAVVPGDDYSRASNAGRQLASRCPDLKRSERTDTHNPGITFVEL